MRHNLLYNLSRSPVDLFTVSTVYFLNKTNQTEKVLDSEKCAPSRDSNEWIHRPDVRPVKWYGRSASLRIKK